MEVAPGIRRITLPLPTGPRHVHCYLADGTLFDTGLGLGDTDWSALGIERIAITHMHPTTWAVRRRPLRRPARPSTRERSTTRSASGSGAPRTGPSGWRHGSAGTACRPACPTS